MQFVLTGFTQDMAFRVFAFEGVGADRIRTRYTVRADLGLVRRYGIPVQELPLLCRALLDKSSEAEQKRALTFTEDEMDVYARNCAEAREAAARKKPPRRPLATNVGAAWRAPQS
jgi:hypothetical protein